MSETVLEKPESWMWHLIGFILPASVIAGNILGEWWVLGGTVLALVIYPILDCPVAYRECLSICKGNIYLIAPWHI